MRKRLRSTIKWGGTVLTVLLLVVWVGSAWWHCSVATPNLVIKLEGGCLLGSFSTAWNIVFASVDWDGPARHQEQFHWWFNFFRNTYMVGANSQILTGTDTFFTIPLWPAVLLTAVPSGWCWYRDGRRAPGLCIKCGYDLRGAEHEVCPECGSTCKRAAPVR